MKNMAAAGRDRPPTLAEIQSWLSARILDPVPSSSADLADWITPVPRERAEERLAVYVDGYPARLHEALQESFPALANVLGPAAMTGLIRRFVAAVHLQSYNLSDAGAEL